MHTRYSSQVVSAKVELFAFVEVDDRRSSKTCHVVVCSGAKGIALNICDAMTAAYAEAAAETKRRAGAVDMCVWCICAGRKKGGGVVLW